MAPAGGMTGEPGERRARARAWLGGFATGAALAYVFDPRRGRRRRHAARERTAATLRRSARHVLRAGRATALQTLGHARGALHRLRPPPPPREPLDDAGLAHKVESVLFRDPKVPKGAINVNAENGTVFLRGQLESTELIDELMAAVRRIAGVGEAVSLLHLPGIDAPHPPAGHRPPAGT